MGEDADVAIVNARVWTGQRAGGTVDAVAITGGRITGLGMDQVRELIGSTTRVVDGAGATVTPGFQDAHCHPPMAGLKMMQVWLNDCSSRQEYLAEVDRFAAAEPGRRWITGGGWSTDAFPGAWPRREDLDRVVPDRPVYLESDTCHSAWVNSAALAAMGITKGTPDPLDGRIERDPRSGEPTGTLHEGAAYRYRDRFVDEPGDGDVRRAILLAQRHLHALGITGWQDAWVTPQTLMAYRSLASSGELTARVVGALWWDRYSGLDQIEAFVEQRARGRLGRFHPTSVKIMVDGVIGNQTAAVSQAYLSPAGHEHAGSGMGLMYLEPEVLTAAVVALDARGFQVHMHAIGDRAIGACLDAVAAARQANGPSDGRHHIAHLQMLDPSDVPRFRDLGVVANCQPFWAQSDGDMRDRTLPVIGAERGRLMYLFGDLERGGARLAMGSDWPVSTADPLQEMAVGVSRTGLPPASQEPFLPRQRLSLESCLRGFTAGSAYVDHDDDAGRLAVGARADLALLNGDLFDPGIRASDLAVDLTMASGRVVFEREVSS